MKNLFKKNTTLYKTTKRLILKICLKKIIRLIHLSLGIFIVLSIVSGAELHYDAEYYAVIIGLIFIINSFYI